MLDLCCSGTLTEVFEVKVKLFPTLEHLFVAQSVRATLRKKKRLWRVKSLMTKGKKAIIFREKGQNMMKLKCHKNQVINL